MSGHLQAADRAAEGPPPRPPSGDGGISLARKRQTKPAKKAGALLVGLRRLFGLGEVVERMVPGDGVPEEISRAVRETAAVGRLSLVGLEHVREELGERWPALAERVRSIAEKVIGGHLLPGDVFEMNDAGDYVVLFCRLSDREAEFKAAAIARDITRRLLGTEWGRLSVVEAVCASVPRAAAEADQLDAVLTASFALGTRFVSTEVVAGRADHVDDEMSASAAVTLGDGPPARVRAETTATPIHLAPTWRYMPIWDRRGDALIRFRIVPGVQPSSPSQAEVAGRTAPCGAALHSAVFAADLAAVRAASAEIIRLAGLDRRLPIICPVHAGALEFPGLRRTLVETLRYLPPNVRRLLTIELTAPPIWSTSMASEKFIEEVRAMKVSVSSCLPASGAALAALPSLPGPVTIQLPSPAPEAACIQFLNAFVASASKAGLECGLAGVSTRPIAQAAASAGVRFVSGPAIHPEILALKRAIRFQLDDLCDHRQRTPA